MAQITIPAVSDNLDTVLQFVDTQMQNARCPASFIQQVELATEEIFVNIASYAYEPGPGTAWIDCVATESPCRVTITFCDAGTPYNPLQKADPDVHLSAAERQIGGLGILMVKKLMDKVHYEFRDGKNCLTIQKEIP